ncbi:hypothetical protein ALO94_201184 [Pseudomonas syringae pv. spinaceae]|uniref:Uncharacterized protein n=1 Tax=Pseudomonas syringae pv. spinaceae TaxID=264459 RepID=A0A0Q0B9E9_PSESX|nr:hypothetical protein ALO94_201184 [Pseudomonas syringae pv. spinaceae]
MINGKATTTMLVSLGLVMNSSTIPPTTIKALRRNIDSDEPMTDCNSVVSAVRRDWISELRLFS